MDELASTSIQQQVERTRANYEAFDRGDVGQVLDQMADDIVWHVAGQSRLAGERRGKQAVIEFLGELAQITGGTYKLKVHDILASEDHVVVLAGESAERNGETFENNVVHVAHYDSEGRTKEFWAIEEDQEKGNRFFS